MSGRRSSADNNLLPSRPLLPVTSTRMLPPGSGSARGASAWRTGRDYRPSGPAVALGGRSVLRHSGARDAARRRAGRPTPCAEHVREHALRIAAEAPYAAGLAGALAAYALLPGVAPALAAATIFLALTYRRPRLG